MEKENTIKISANHVRTLFPHNPSELGNYGSEFGLVAWQVVKIDSGEDIELGQEVVVKGLYPEGINPTSTYSIIAKEEYHPKYGKQYSLIYYTEEVDFTKIRNQKAFLRSFLTELQIDNLYKSYDDPIEIISKHDVEALIKVKGVGEATANRIINNFEEKRELGQIYSELDEFGLTSNFISKLIEKYKNPDKIIDTVKNHPYQLVNDIDGVGFIKADEIAHKSGINNKDEERIKSFIVWYLNKQGEIGDSYITASELNHAIYDMLGPKSEIVEFYNEDKTDNNLSRAIKDLEEKGIIVLENNKSKGQRRVYLTKFYNLEKKIAYHLKRIESGNNDFNAGNIQEKLKAVEDKQGFEFTDEQKEGINLGLDNQICLITGLAGSGKSSLVSGILGELNQYDFAQCALSGKAAAKLQEVTGAQGQTIHRLLGFTKGKFTYNQTNPLPYDIIILDEISLVGGEIFLDLLKAIPTGAKFYMLGDPGQLEAIGPLNLAEDMINSSIIPTVKLKQVHRQAKKSGILTTAYDVRNQVQLFEGTNYSGVQIRGELEDMILDVEPEKDNNRAKVLGYYKKYYNSDLVNKDPMKIQVISPVKDRGDTSVFNLNKDIQAFVNPPELRADYEKVLIKQGRKKDNDILDKSFYIQTGDKVMCIKNVYNVETVEETTVDIFNGWTGIVESVDNFNQEVVVDFPLSSYKVVLPEKNIGNILILGYASTCHKMQGSSNEIVIGVIDYSTPPSMLTSQLVYTLLTRAKKKCILIAQTGALRKAISTNYVSTKRTFLQEFLMESYNDLKKEVKIIETDELNSWFNKSSTSLPDKNE